MFLLARNEVELGLESFREECEALEYIHSRWVSFRGWSRVEVPNNSRKENTEHDLCETGRANCKIPYRGLGAVTTYF